MRDSGARPLAARSVAKPRAELPVQLPRTPKLVVFDWDGTLGDTYPQLRYIVTNAARDAGVPELRGTTGSDPYRPIIDGAGLEVMFRRLAPNGTHEQQQRFIEAFQHHTATAPASLVQLKPGIKQEIAALRKKHPGIKLAILSSRPQAVVERLAELSGLSDVFTKVVGTGGSAIAEKPSPEGLELILNELSVSAKDGVMVGDTSMDIRAGKAAGMHTVALRDGMGDGPSLAEAKADIVLESLPGFVNDVIPAKATTKRAPSANESVAHP